MMGALGAGRVNRCLAEAWSQSRRKKDEEEGAGGRPVGD